MKKIIASLCVILCIGFFACTNTENKPTTDNNTPKTPADTLLHDVMENHDIGMAKMGKINQAEQEVQRIMDSISKLPGKAQKAAEPMKVKLKSMLFDLQTAKSEMEKWMDEFNMDSSINNMKQRVDYLVNEKLKVSSIKEDMISSLRRTDSVIKSKF